MSKDFTTTQYFMVQFINHNIFDLDPWHLDSVTRRHSKRVKGFGNRKLGEGGKGSKRNCILPLLESIRHFLVSLHYKLSSLLKPVSAFNELDLAGETHQSGLLMTLFLLSHFRNEYIFNIFALWINWKTVKNCIYILSSYLQFQQC